MAASYGNMRVARASALDEGSLSVLENSLAGSFAEGDDHFIVVKPEGDDWGTSSQFLPGMNDEEFIFHHNKRNDRETFMNSDTTKLSKFANEDGYNHKKNGLKPEDGNNTSSDLDGSLDTRSFRKEAHTQMFGGLAIQKTLLSSFKTKTSVASRNDTTLAGKDLAKLSVGEGFFRQSRFENLGEVEMLKINAWNAFRAYSSTQGDLVIDGGSRGLPIAILVEALSKVSAGTLSEKDLVAIVARQSYASKAMLSWREFQSLCFEIFHLNRGDFEHQGLHGGTAVRPHTLSRSGSAEVQRPSKLGLVAPPLKHQPMARHQPTEAETVMTYDASLHGPRTHEYHLEQMGFHGGVFDDSTASMNSSEAFRATAEHHRTIAASQKVQARQRADPVNGLYSSQSLESGTSQSRTPSSLRRTASAVMNANEIKVLVPKMKQSAYQLLLQKQRGASSIVMAQLPPGATTEIGTSHAFVDIEVGGTAKSTLGTEKIKVATTKLNSMMMDKFEKEKTLKRQQTKEMSEMYPLKDQELVKAEALERLAQPLMKDKVYAMTHRNETQLAKWQKMKEQRDAREARSEKIESRKSALSFVSHLVNSGEKESVKKVKRHIELLESSAKLETVQKCKAAEEQTQHNIRERLSELATERKDSALNLRVAINSSIELTASILEEQQLARNRAAKLKNGDFKLNPSSSALLRVPDVLTERVQKARSLDAFLRAKAEQKSYIEDTMDMRIKSYANSKFERMSRAAESTTRINYGTSVDIDRQASIFLNDHLLNSSTGTYLYDGIGEGENSNHHNSHKAKRDTGIESLDLEFNSSSLVGSSTDFLHVITPNYRKYTSGGSKIISAPASVGASRLPSPDTGTGGRRVLISRADGRDLAEPGHQSIPTSTPDIRKQPYKDKSDRYVSPHGKNVYPEPKTPSGPSLNTDSPSRTRTGSPPHFRLSVDALGTASCQSSPDSVGSKDDVVIRHMALSEYQEHVSLIDESPRKHTPGNSPTGSVGSGNGGTNYRQPQYSAPLATLTDDSTNLATAELAIAD